MCTNCSLLETQSRYEVVRLQITQTLQQIRAIVIANGEKKIYLKKVLTICTLHLAEAVDVTSADDSDIRFASLGVQPDFVFVNT